MGLPNSTTRRQLSESTSNAPSTSAVDALDLHVAGGCEHDGRELYGCVHCVWRQAEVKCVGRACPAGVASMPREIFDLH